MNKSIDDYFCDWEASAFGYGYGTGEELTIPAIWAFFVNCPNDEPNAECYNYQTLEEACGRTVAWLLINTFCASRIIEYGTSPRFGWLTKEGLALRAYILSKTPDELVALTGRSAPEYIHCYPDYCNCGDKPCSNPFWKLATK